MENEESINTIARICLDIKEIFANLDNNDAKDLLEVALECLEDANLKLEGLVHCTICGDFHDTDSVPLSCQTGDGE